MTHYQAARAQQLYGTLHGRYFGLEGAGASFCTCHEATRSLQYGRYHGPQVLAPVRNPYDLCLMKPTRRPSKTPLQKSRPYFRSCSSRYTGPRSCCRAVRREAAAARSPESRTSPKRADMADTHQSVLENALLFFKDHVNHGIQALYHTVITMIPTWYMDHTAFQGSFTVLMVFCTTLDERHSKSQDMSEP